MIRRLLRDAADFVHPPFCPLCGERSEPELGTVALCSDCHVEWRPPRNDWCSRCGAPVGPYLDSTNGCSHCRGERFRFAGVRALGAYEGRLRAACRLGKKAGGAPLVAALAGLLADVHARWFADVAAEVVVPVPRHWSRHWWSGDDAAAVAARALGCRLRRPVASAALVKLRRTKPQATLAASERRRSLVDAFAATATRPIANRRLLLVDDVLTTGTTADRCARALLEAGAATVHVAVLARGIGA